MQADSGHAPGGVVGRPTSSPRLFWCPLVPPFPRATPGNVTKEKEGLREVSPTLSSKLEAGPANSVLLLDAPTPFCGTLLLPLPRKTPPLRSAIGGSPPRPAYAPCSQDATAGRPHSLPLFLSRLLSSLPFSLFALFLSLRLIFLSLSLSLVSSPRSFFLAHPLLPPCFILSLFLSPNARMRPTRVPHTIASPARAAHMATLTRGVCGPTSCRGPCHVAPRPQRHTAHGLCSLVSRAHDTSQRRTERPDRQIALSFPGSACGAFSLPLSPTFFLFFFSLFPPRALSLPVLLSPLFLLFPPPILGRGARAIYHALGPACTPGVYFYHPTFPRPRATPLVLCVYTRRCQALP